jgi:hypothetical protein
MASKFFTALKDDPKHEGDNAYLWEIALLQKRL